MSGNFRAKCVYANSLKCYTKDKIYEIVNGCLIDDKDEIMYNDLISIEDLQKRSYSSWELVDENTKNLSLTITSEKATISDGEDTFEVDNNWYKTERDMIDDLLDRYYSEKNNIKVGDTVKVVDKGYQYKTYSDFIFENAEELQKQMSATEFAGLILNFENGVSVSERACTYKVNLINSIFRLPNRDIKVAIISNNIRTFIIDIRGLEKVKN